MNGHSMIFTQSDNKEKKREQFVLENSMEEEKSGLSNREKPLNVNDIDIRYQESRQTNHFIKVLTIFDEVCQVLIKYIF